jgi:hypothetical protein
MNKINTDYINQHDVIRRYLKGKLSAEETLEFEEYMLDKPELLEQLELDSVMMEQLPNIPMKTSLVASTWWAWWRPTYSHLVAVAACAVMTVSLFMGGNNPTTSITTASPDILYLGNYRSVQPMLSVDFSNAAQSKILVLSLPLVAEGEFDVLAENLDTLQREVLQHQLRANSEGELVVVLGTATLPAGRYNIDVQASSSAQQVMRNTIELINHSN